MRAVGAALTPILLLALVLAIFAAQAGGTVEGRFSSQVEVGGSQFSAAADFDDPGGAP